MNDEVLSKLHFIENEILDEFVRICSIHKLQYFLSSGTLLGAIRHKGFIPWDDDIDIEMPRADYEKFIKVCMKELDSKYYLDCIYTNKDYWLPFIKIRKNNTHFMEKLMSNFKGHNGIWIDIFPLDTVIHEKSFFQRIQGDLVKNLSNVLILKSRFFNLEKISKKQHLVKFICRFIPNRFIHFVLKRVMTIFNLTKGKYFVNLATIYHYTKLTMPKDKYLPASKTKFCNKKYDIPNDSDYVLTRIYGDYMKLPPIEKRVTHSPVLLDFGDTNK